MSQTLAPLREASPPPPDMQPLRKNPEPVGPPSLCSHLRWGTIYVLRGRWAKAHFLPPGTTIRLQKKSSLAWSVSASISSVIFTQRQHDNRTSMNKYNTLLFSHGICTRRVQPQKEYSLGLDAFFMETNGKQRRGKRTRHGKRSINASSRGEHKPVFLFIEKLHDTPGGVKPKK